MAREKKIIGPTGKAHHHVTAGQTRWLGQFVTPSLDWQEEVIRMLLDASIHGVSQTDLINRVYGLGIRTKQLTEFLETYRTQNGIQRFTIRNGTVWRATTKLRSLV